MRYSKISSECRVHSTLHDFDCDMHRLPFRLIHVKHIFKYAVHTNVVELLSYFSKYILTTQCPVLRVFSRDKQCPNRVGDGGV